MARDPLLERVRSLVMAMPGAHEVEAWGAPTFRVKNKLFAMYAEAGNSHHGRPGVWIKSDASSQEMLIDLDARRYFKPPYVGPSGWIGVYLDQRVSWKGVEAHLCDAWRMIAPKKLQAAAPAMQTRTADRRGRRVR